MAQNTQRCFRCKGRKTMFKFNNIYNHTDTGGVEVNCPLCLGEGRIPKLDEAIVQAKKKVKGSKEVKDGEIERAQEN